MRRVMLVLAVLASAALGACNPDAAEQDTQLAEKQAPPSDAAPAFVGTWAADAAGCAIPQERNEAPHVFTAEGYDQHEAHCTFTTVDKVAESRWHIAASCSVEGDEQEVTWDLAVEGDTLTMLPSTQRFVRCP